MKIRKKFPPPHAVQELEAKLAQANSAATAAAAAAAAPAPIVAATTASSSGISESAVVERIKKATAPIESELNTVRHKLSLAQVRGERERGREEGKIGEERGEIGGDSKAGEWRRRREEGRKKRKGK